MIVKENKPGLYIHIPFCNKICSYCNFSKLVYLEKYSLLYLNALKEELHKYDSFSFLSIYIGGGTPSSLSYDELNYLFDIIEPYKSKDCLITIEINPDIELKKIDLFSKRGVNRISIGVQSFNKEILSLINRDSNFEHIKSLISYINKNGINDINLDLMYGFNNQSINELKEDLEKFIKLNPTHISTYCLQVENDTILAINKYKELEQEEIRSQYDFIVDYLKEYGFNRYEVSNFAKSGYESKHNLIYWNNQEYGGVGLNASSYINGIRYTNTKSLNKYLKRDFNDYKEELTFEDKEFYFIMLGLRKEEGISLKEYKLLFNKDFISAYKEKIEKLLNLDDIEIKNNYLRVKKDKLFILDYILRILLY